MNILNSDINRIILLRLFSIIVAVLLDIIIGDPHSMPHIVKAFGKNIERIYRGLLRMFPVKSGRDEDANIKLMIGQTIVIRMIVGNLLIFGIIFFVLDKYVPVAGIIARIIVIYQCISARQLQKEAMIVLKELSNGINKGRIALSNIVGRDTNNLDYDAILRADVETVAENTSDGVIAPLFYIIIFGALGGVVYKVVNTMDSMLGYHSEEFEYIGRAAAKMDDFFNFMPSRIAAGFMILSAYLCNMNGKGALAIYKRDRKKSASPNSAQTESVVAGALNLRLLGPASYGGVLYDKPYIGDDIKNIDAADVKASIKLMYSTEIITLLVGTLIYAAIIMVNYSFFFK